MLLRRKIHELRLVDLAINRNLSVLKAALWDNVELLEDLLQEETHLIDCLDSWGRAPIHAAAITADSRCLPMLINAGANVDATCGPRGDSKVGAWPAAFVGVFHVLRFDSCVTCWLVDLDRHLSKEANFCQQNHSNFVSFPAVRRRYT